MHVIIMCPQTIWKKNKTKQNKVKSDYKNKPHARYDRWSILELQISSPWVQTNRHWVKTPGDQEIQSLFLDLENDN